MTRLITKTTAAILALLLLLAAGCGGAPAQSGEQTAPITESADAEGSGAETASDAEGSGAETASDAESGAKTIAAPSQTSAGKPTVNAAESGVEVDQSREKFTNKSFIDEMTPHEGTTLKIAFVGDEVTYGNGTSDVYSESFTAQLSELMENKVRIGNFGKPNAYMLPPENRYNVKGEKPELWYQNTTQFQKSLAYEPDIVVIMLGLHDFRSMSCEEAKAGFEDALLDLADKYRALDSVQKIYIATGIMGCSNAAIYEMMTGPMQDIQKEAAAKGGYEVIDIGAMTQSFLDAQMPFTKGKQNPDAAGCTEIARAFYAFFKEQPFTPGSLAQAEGGVVYVKTGGEAFGMGSSPEKPLDSLAKAAALLREEGGTVVICGDYELAYETPLPANKKPITITSEYGGTAFPGKLILAHNLYFNGEYTLRDLSIEATKENAMLVCGYNSVTFGEGLACSWGGNATGYPGITAGCVQQIAGCPVERAGLHGECVINIESGHWSFVRGGNTRLNGRLHLADIDAGAELEINITGGVFENTSGRHLTAATGMNNVSGTCRMNISGGTFLGPVFALSRHGDLAKGDVWSMTGRAELTVTGGDFREGIHAYQDPDNIAEGEITLTVTQALADAVDYTGFTEVTVR